MRIYAGSDGDFYTEQELSYHIETGAWKSCLWDPDEGWEVVETADHHALWLVPINEEELPDGFAIKTSDVGLTIVDTRDS